MLQQISESELILMKIVWKNNGRALFSHIMTELEEQNNEWKKNTVLTLLSRLMEKKYLKADKIGRRNEYIALVTEGEYQAVQTDSFIDRVYSGNAKGLVTALLSQSFISPEELDEIERFWRKQ